MPRNRHIRNPRGCKRTSPQIYPRKPTFRGTLVPFCRENGLVSYRYLEGFRIVRKHDSAFSWLCPTLHDAIEQAYFIVEQERELRAFLASMEGSP